MTLRKRPLIRKYIFCRLHVDTGLVQLYITDHTIKTLQACTYLVFGENKHTLKYHKTKKENLLCIIFPRRTVEIMLPKQCSPFGTTDQTFSSVDMNPRRVEIRTVGGKINKARAIMKNMFDICDADDWTIYEARCLLALHKGHRGHS